MRDVELTIESEVKIIMYNLVIFSLLAATILVQISCGDSSAKVVTKELYGGPLGQPSTWTEIPLPFEAETVFVYDGRIMVVSSEGMGIVNDDNEFRSLPAFSVKRRYRFDGSMLEGRSRIGLRPLTSASHLTARLCNATSGGVVSSSLFAHAVCDHGEQVWIANSTDLVTELNIIDFAYSDISSSKNIEIGPGEPVALGDELVIPAYGEKTPILLSMNVKDHSVDLLWRGTQEQGAVMAVASVGQIGWMSVGSGELLQSNDGGRTWLKISDLSHISFTGGVRLMFVDPLNGFLVAEHAVFSTLDGGKTWSSISQDIEDSIVDIRSGDQISVVLGREGIYFKKLAEPEWHLLEPVLESRISTVVVLRNKVFVIVTGKLFFTEV